MAAGSADALVTDPAGMSGPSQDINAAGRHRLNRIEGYDAARAIALFAMVLVNCYVIFPGSDAYPGWYDGLFDFLFGRAAVLFVMLAGVGVALMSRRAHVSSDRAEYKKIRTMLFKRSLVLLVMGYLFMQYWSADILHFYSLYLITGAFLLDASSRRLRALILIFMFISALIFCVTGGAPGMEDWIREPGLFSGILDDLLFNGYYPAFPWLAFLITGMWIGRHEIMSSAVRKRNIFTWALAVFLGAEFLAGYLPDFLFETLEVTDGGLIDMFLISGAFPVTPLFSISASAGSIIVIMLALTLTRYRLCAKLAGALACTGRMTLTIYISHVFIVFGIQKLLALQSSNDVYRIINVTFPAGFCLVSIIFSNIWFKFFERGPLEWLLRTCSGLI